MKRLLSLVLGLLLLTTTLPVAAFPDTDGTMFETYVDVLEGLGIVEGNDEGLFEQNKSVTRAELTVMMLRTMGVIMAEGRAIFSDVSENHWAFDVISTAFDLGIINGISKTEFAPDASVTKEQAVKMVVCMLGYGVKADALGGYPAGYFDVASQLGILSGVPDGEFTRGIMARLLYNSLSVELFEKTSYGNEDGNYASGKETVLSAYLHIKTISARISATHAAEIESPQASLSESEVLLTENGTGAAFVAEAGNTNASNRLGVSGKFYLKEKENGSLEIVAYAPNADTELITISADKILSADKKEIVYEGDSAFEQKKISFHSPIVVWNGSVKTDWTAADLWPDLGSVKFISSGNEELLLIESYVSYIVQAVNRETNTVFFKDGESIVIDETDNNVIINADVSSFSEWGVLSVAKGAVKTKYEYSFEQLTGKVSVISTDSATIGGVTYPVAKSLLSSDSLIQLSLGQDCAYFLDFTGAVAAVNNKYSENYKYGILVSAGIKKGLDAEPQLKIFTQDGEMQVYELSEKVTFADYASGYGEQRISRSDLIGEGIYNSIFIGDKVIRQLLRYELNDNNEIIRIDTAADYTYRINDDSRYDVFSWDSLTGTNRLPITSGGDYYEDGIIGIYMAGDLGTFAGRAAPRAKTKFFVMPDSDTAEDNEYAIRAYNSLSHNNDGERYGNMRFYDIDDECIIGAMVWVVASTGGTANVTYPDNMLDHICVTSVVQTLNADGEPCMKISGYKWKYYHEVSFTVSEDFECLYKMATANIYEDTKWYSRFDGSSPVRDIPVNGQERGAMFMKAGDIGFGDIIQVDFTAGGEPKVISVRYRGAYPGQYEGGISNGRPSFGTKNEYYIHGVSEYTVDKVTDYGYVTTAKLYATPGYFTGQTVKRMISNAPEKVLFLDRKNGAHSFGTKNDVRVGDTLLRVSQTTGSYMLIVVR